ncbi:MAG: carbon starvation CstA family protein [Planctomycetia bacterium]|nr:carbon starvation CstA family protein [Planctomycetia bacterium]
MLLFWLGVAILLLGYWTYGKFVEAVVAPDDRATPAEAMYDGVDFVPLPHWKNMLIQLLNIAGVGPVIGVILGIKFGVVAFLIIPIGNIIGGAVHDFVSGMFSLRNRGCNLPAQIRMTLGRVYYVFFAFFMSLLLLLVVTTFVNVPAQLIDKEFLPQVSFFWCAVGVIFLYYIFATLFPVDKIIGKIYPFFGAMLLLGTGMLCCSLVYNNLTTPEDFLTETEAFRAQIPNQGPIIPCLFVTIACGILSGFHATQSPIIARTMKTERQAYSSFYGMMVVEGLIAMIWAAGALAVYHHFPEYLTKGGTETLGKITQYFLGGWMGTATVLAVVVLAITSGDTALRSLRLSLSEIFHIDQRALGRRLIVSIPLVVIVTGLLWWSNKDAAAFGVLWNYFAWGNQVLAASTLMGCSVWLMANQRCFWITYVPGLFMTFVVLTFILWTAPDRGGPIGFGFGLETSYLIAGAISFVLGVLTLLRGRRMLKEGRTMMISLDCPNTQKTKDFVS